MRNRQDVAPPPARLVRDGGPVNFLNPIQNIDIAEVEAEDDDYLPDEPPQLVRGMGGYINLENLELGEEVEEKMPINLIPRIDVERFARSIYELVFPEAKQSKIWKNISKKVGRIIYGTFNFFTNGWWAEYKIRAQIRNFEVINNQELAKRICIDALSRIIQKNLGDERPEEYLRKISESGEDKNGAICDLVIDKKKVEDGEQQPEFVRRILNERKKLDAYCGHNI